MRTRQLLISFTAGMGLVVALLSLLHAQPVAAAWIVYVDQTATGSDDGSSWDNAYTHLQDALGAVSDGAEIWVATGVYTPGIARTDAFTLPPGVALYGGFAATETVRSERDWESNVTVLSGDIGGDDANGDSNSIAETWADIVMSNTYHVLWLDGVTGEAIVETTVVDGFTITAGQSDGSYPHSDGGGLYCDGRGAGNECSPTIANVVFSGNLAGNYGGGMYNEGRSGGASSPTLTNVTFAGNRANLGGGMNNRGYDGGTSSPTLTNVAFRGNQAGYAGGGMYSDGNGSGSESNPVLTNVLFSGNRADNGGGMDNYGAWSGNCSPVLTNVTFAGNQADNGGAMNSNGENGTSSPSLINVILWGNTVITSGAQLYNHHATPVLSYTLIQSGTNDIVNDGTGSVTYGPGILTVDPQFVAPVSGSSAPTTTGDYRLQAGSPAINVGSNAAVTAVTDLDGNPRISEEAVDLGAYESQWPYGVFLPVVLRDYP